MLPAFCVKGDAKQRSNVDPAHRIGIKIHWQVFSQLMQLCVRTWFLKESETRTTASVLKQDPNSWKVKRIFKVTEIEPWVCHLVSYKTMDKGAVCGRNVSYIIVGPFYFFLFFLTLHWRGANPLGCTLGSSDLKQKSIFLLHDSWKNNHMKPANGSICTDSTFSISCKLASSLGVAYN